MEKVTIYVDAEDDFKSLYYQLEDACKALMLEELDHFESTGEWLWSPLNIRAERYNGRSQSYLVVSDDDRADGVTLYPLGELADAWPSCHDLIEEDNFSDSELDEDELEAAIRRKYIGRESEYCTDWTMPMNLVPENPLFNMSEAIDAEVRKAAGYTMLDELVDMFTTIADEGFRTDSVSLADAGSLSYDEAVEYLNGFSVSDFEGGAEEVARNYMTAFYPEYL